MLIVSDKNVLNELQELFTQHNLQFRSNFTGYADLSKAEIAKITNNDGYISDETGRYLDSDGNAATGIVDTKSSFLEGMYGFTGGFLFTGFLLGISFLLGAA